MTKWPVGSDVRGTETTLTPVPGVRERLRGVDARRAIVLVPILALIVAWQLSSLFIPSYIFPGPLEVLRKALGMLQTTSTYAEIRVTLQRIIGGFLLSSVVGAVIGIACGLVPALRVLLLPLVKVVMGIPAISWVLLALVWFRSMETRVWFIMFILVFPITAINTYDGIRAVPNELYEMVRSLRPSRYGMLRLLIIPAAAPFIFSGMRVSLSFASRIAIFAEALSAATGVGAAMFMANQFFDTTAIFVWTLVLIVIISLLDLMLGRVEQRWFKWRTEIQKS